MLLVFIGLVLVWVLISIIDFIRVCLCKYMCVYIRVYIYKRVYIRLVEIFLYFFGGVFLRGERVEIDMVALVRV